MYYELRNQMAAAVRILYRAGLLDPYGHVSVRVEDNVVAVLAHLHGDRLVMGDITARQITLVDMAGNSLPGEAEGPGEIFIHTEIYRRRPEVRSVVHTHPLNAIMLSAGGKPVRPVVAKGHVFAPSVPIFPNSAQIESLELGQELAEFLGGRPGAVLREHGAVTVGRRLEEAVILQILLEELAEIQCKAMSIGIPESELGKGVTTPAIFRNDQVDTRWNRWLALLEREGGLQGVSLD